MGSDAAQIGLGFLRGFLSSSVFVLVLFIGFCVVFGFLKTKRRAGGAVVKDLDEALSGRPPVYLAPTAPHGPADQLQAPELREAAARRS
jgi:hypothetical protein